MFSLAAPALPPPPFPSRDLLIFRNSFSRRSRRGSLVPFSRLLVTLARAAIESDACIAPPHHVDGDDTPRRHKSFSVRKPRTRIACCRPPPRARRTCTLPPPDHPFDPSSDPPTDPPLYRVRETSARRGARQNDSRLFRSVSSSPPILPTRIFLDPFAPPFTEIVFDLCGIRLEQDRRDRSTRLSSAIVFQFTRERHMIILYYCG